MDIAIRIFQLLFSLSILVFIHELGHYSMARFFGARVEKFYLFFNPWFSLFKWKSKRSGTTYGLGWVPLGGYCQIAGMIDESLDTEAMASEPKPDEFRSKKPFPRLMIMAGGVIFNVILAFIIYTGVTLAWGTKVLPSDQVSSGKTIALSNKETLVVAGELIISLAKRNGARILPVDSEHSAIYQCLVGEEGNPLERILLTASGGPFRSYKSIEELEAVTVEAALRHPNWSMGAKVTIDSASLMNKGLEMIEARWLFDTPADKIEVLVHPQSIIHSMVEFADGSIKAQLGQPDMRLPISYALGLTERVANDYSRLNFLEHTFTFERPNMELFPNLALAYRALEIGGTAPCVLNAANEVAVEAFLAGSLGFRTMSTLIAQALEAHRPERSYDLQLLSELDAAVRAESRERLNHIR